MRGNGWSFVRVAVCLCATLAVLVAYGVQAASTGTSGTAESYYKALHGKISLKLAKGSDGGKPTVELAVAWICKKAGVPYQVKRSRTLGKDKVKARVEPINYTDVVAGRAIVAVASKAGLAMKIDDRGVYLFPKSTDTTAGSTTPTALTPAQRFQLGQTLHVEVNAVHGKDVDSKYWEYRDVQQEVQLEIKLTAHRTFKSLKVVPHLYARIQKESLHESKYRNDKRPRYGPNKDFVEVHTETILVAGLARMQPYTATTKAIMLAYEVEGWYRGGKRRTGEKYYGYVVDIYIGDQLIKSVASTTKLLELLNRNKMTGFPID